MSVTTDPHGDFSTDAPHYDVTVPLSGYDGNAFAVMGRVVAALRKAGASTEDIDRYRSESMAGDCDNLLRVAMRWVNVT